MRFDAFLDDHADRQRLGCETGERGIIDRRSEKGALQPRSGLALFGEGKHAGVILPLGGSEVRFEMEDMYSSFRGRRGEVIQQGIPFLEEFPGGGDGCVGRVLAPLLPHSSTYGGQGKSPVEMQMGRSEEGAVERPSGGYCVGRVVEEGDLRWGFETGCAKEGDVWWEDGGVGG